MKFGEAGGAELRVFQVDALDVVGRSHDTGPVETVLETEGVAEFVDGFFLQAILEEEVVGREAIELFVQAAGGDESAATAQLGFAEDESEHGDIQVERSNSQQSDAGIERERFQALQDAGGMILAAGGVKSETGKQAIFTNMTGDVEVASQFGGQIVEEFQSDFTAGGGGRPRARGHRKQVNGFHQLTETSRLRP